ncbi:DUF485 domain-containing protein [Pseudoclavibacter caeni]|jgi:uncharacterized membrane protein (DUF485 family)|nr:hypothetical protein [Pseudoclavibacter caeni]NYJ97644.1 uncharacterized membrane protein (DUF485 family) [Pseudoclavibacter caeni]
MTAGPQLDRRGQRRSFAWAMTMIAFLALYVLVVFQRAIILIGVDDVIARVMGVCLLLFPLLGVYAIWAEIRFAVDANRLIERLAEEEGLPTDDLPVLPSGRADRAVAGRRLERYTRDADAHPDDWRSLLRCGLMLDAAGHRREARRAIVDAIRAERAGRGTAAAASSPGAGPHDGDQE